MLHLHTILVVAGASLVTYIHACTFAPGTKFPEPHTMEETLYRAHIVVHVRASTEVLHESDNMPAYLTIKCVFKDTNNTLPADNNTIILDYDYFNSCSGSWPTKDKEFIVALTITESELDPGKFRLDEPAIMESAAFEARQDRLEHVLKLCGMQHPRGDACPTPKQEDKDTATDNDGDEDAMKAREEGEDHQDDDDDDDDDDGEDKCIKAEYNGTARNAMASVLTLFMAVLLGQL